MSTSKIYLYAFLHIALISLDAFNSQISLHTIKKSNYSFEETYGFYYMLIFGKLILIMDVYYFSSFYFKKTLNTVIQIKFIKILAMIIWILIGIRLGFSSGIIVYLCLKSVSYILLWLFKKEEAYIAYHMYNSKVSLDLQIIKTYLISEVIEAFKSTAVICAVLVIYFDLTIISASIYIILFYIKIVVLLVDKILYKRMTDRMKYYRISTIIMSLLCILGTICIVPLVVKNGVKKEPVFLFNEVLIMFIAILLLYYLYLKKNEYEIIKRSNN
ncbi:hypothetical protein P3W45_001062 [Vairimorpha bombi]|jgi:hypothetical protein